MEKQIKKINQLLIKKFGVPPRPETPPDPVDMLIATILSQNTNDKNSYKAFNNLKEKFNSWEDVSKLSPSQIEKYIKVAGLGKQKSKAIKSFLTSILKEQGQISLNHLVKNPDDEIISELTNFGGVGVKTASCVLLFALRRNICPVDTHVHRTTNRIGFVNTSTPDKTFFEINKHIPAKTAHSFHTNLIRLGREICKPTNPSCSICPLLKICQFQNKNLSGKPTTKKNDFMLLDSIE